MLYRCVGGIDIPSYRLGRSRHYTIVHTKLKRRALRNGGSYYYEMYRTWDIPNAEEKPCAN
jgi:hypothetical protein